MHTAQTCDVLDAHKRSSWWYSWGLGTGFDGSFCDAPDDAAARRWDIEHCQNWANRQLGSEAVALRAHGLRSGRSVSNIIDHHARCPPFTGTSQRECSECAEDRSMMWE